MDGKNDCNVILPTTTVDGFTQLKAAVDMRYVTGSVVLADMNIPWTADVHFTVNDLGIFELCASFKAPTAEELNAGDVYNTQAIVIMNSKGLHEVPNNLSLDRVIGDFSFDDRDFIVSTANMDVEYSFVCILKPTWCSGGFTFQTKMFLPDEESSVGSVATLLIEDNQDVSQTRFAVYLSYSDNQPSTVESVVSIEPISKDQIYYDVEVRPVEEGAVISHFTVQGLKNCIANAASDQMEEM